MKIVWLTLALLLSAPAALADEGDDRSTGKGSKGKCENAEQCNDQDFSPSFDNSPVIVCLPSSTCNFT